jgi:hypothetical protein
MGYGMTLLEYAKLEKNGLSRGVIETFASGSPVLGVLPFQPVSEGAISYNQEYTLPSVGFRNVNAAYTPASGVILPQVEKVKILGGEIDTDIALIRRFGEKRRQVDIDMKTKAMARYFDKMFIDGDEATYVAQFDGLNKRLTLASGQLLYADYTGTTSADLTENIFHRVIDGVDGTPDMVVMGKAMWRQVEHLFKGSTQFGFTDPALFGYKIPTYAGIPIGILDKDNSNSVILDFDETVGSSGAVCGSIYALKFGDAYLAGIQTTAVYVKDLGEISSPPVVRIRFDWDCGIVLFHPRCAARMSGIKKITGVY